MVGRQEIKDEATKVVSLVKRAENVSNPLKLGIQDINSALHFALSAATLGPNYKGMEIAGGLNGTVFRYKLNYATF